MWDSLVINSSCVLSKHEKYIHYMTSKKERSWEWPYPWICYAFGHKWLILKAIKMNSRGKNSIKSVILYCCHLKANKAIHFPLIQMGYITLKMLRYFFYNEQRAPYFYLYLFYLILHNRHRLAHILHLLRDWKGGGRREMERKEGGGRHCRDWKRQSR